MSHPILPLRLAEAYAGPKGPMSATVTFILLLTVLRIGLLFATPLELYPDEAQYWVWSRHLAFGYFSKPPMIAWLIHFSTAVGGNGEAWVRLPAPLMHGLAAFALAGAGRIIYGGWTGFWAAVIYSAMSGVQLSSAVIATDAPLMAFLSLALWAYGALWMVGKAKPVTIALALGLAIGFALLSKYAALYMVVGNDRPCRAQQTCAVDVVAFAAGLRGRRCARGCGAQSGVERRASLPDRGAYRRQRRHWGRL